MECNIIVSPSKGCIELQKSQIPDPGAREIQVRVHASIISPGTERAWILNLANTPGKYPFEPGYCTAGVVEKIGSEVTGFTPGDRVACVLLSHRSAGNIGEEWAVRIPEAIPFEHAAFMALGQIAMQGVRKARIELGEDVMVIGLGIIGQLAVQFSSLCGAVNVIATDRIESRMKIAVKNGADEALNTGEEGWLDNIGNRLPHVVIESSGSPAAVSMALQAVNQFGRVIILGSTRGESTVDFYSDVHKKAITITGAHAFSSTPKSESSPGFWKWKDDAECFIKLLRKGQIHLDSLITNTINWRDAMQAYENILQWNTDMIGTVIKWAE